MGGFPVSFEVLLSELVPDQVFGTANQDWYVKWLISLRFFHLPDAACSLFLLPYQSSSPVSVSRHRQVRTRERHGTQRLFYRSYPSSSCLSLSRL